jgi:hypothetical protein
MSVKVWSKVRSLTSLNERIQTQSPLFSPIDLNPAHSLFVMLFAWRDVMVRCGFAASMYIYLCQDDL